MRWILLLGVILNAAGAVKILLPALSPATAAGSGPEYLQYRLFTGGTAAVFACLYLYLFVRPAYIVPFLVFGAALKTWALRWRGGLPWRAFAEFGVANAVVGGLFWLCIAV